MKRMFLLLSLPLIVLLAGAVGLAWWSQRVHPEAGLVHGRLRPPSGKRNCVCSEIGTPANAAIAPLMVRGEPIAAWVRMRTAVVEAGGRIEQETDGYLWATFRSRVLHFVDDVELRLDRPAGVIHIRSASRVGSYDWGVNRRRVEALRARLAK